MDVTVQTGHTKAESGMKLITLTHESVQGEHVVVLLQVHADPTEAKALEKALGGIIEHALLETEGEASTRLDGALKEINGLLKGLLLSRTLDDVHAIVALLDPAGTLHVSHAGRAEAYVIRGGLASQITEYSRGKPMPAFIHIASGDLHARDVIICSTQRLLRALTPAQLAQITQHGDQILDEIVVALDGEKERAALAVIHIGGSATVAAPRELPSRRRGRARHGVLSGVSSLSLPSMGGVFGSIGSRLMGIVKNQTWLSKVRGVLGSVRSDLKHPERKRRAHLFLLAGVVAAFLIVWVVVNLATSSQRSQTRTELEQLIAQINEEMQKADNRHLTGDIDAANAILQRAEEQAKQVMDNESGLFRVEALDLLDRIRSKHEEINNIIRLPPKVVVNLSTKNPDILAEGFIGLADGEFVVYDKRDLYRVVLNSVEDPDRLTEDESITDAVAFPRYETTLYQTSTSSVVELINGQPTSMKTEDPAGWIAGVDLEAYLRFLYVLSPQNNQIYKYERLANRYAPPAEYNVNGNLEGALDMAIDGNVYVLKQGGEIIRLFRGEVKPFEIRYAPEGVFENATKLFKQPESNLYILDPVGARVIVVSENTATDEFSYVRQFILDGEQIGELKDIYVDPDEARLYVLDEKRVYVVDLGEEE